MSKAKNVLMLQCNVDFFFYVPMYKITLLTEIIIWSNCHNIYDFGYDFDKEFYLVGKIYSDNFLNLSIVLCIYRYHIYIYI